MSGFIIGSIVVVSMVLAARYPAEAIPGSQLWVLKQISGGK